jgi:hypothetical protein
MPHSAGDAMAVHIRFRKAIISHFGMPANRLIVRAETGENTVPKAIML